MLRCFAPLRNPRKLALQLFREEQRNNASLEGLSAVQKSKVILRTFNQLGAGDMESLKRRATIWHARKTINADVVEPPLHRKGITAYELFYKEQLSNPSIASIASPSVQEKKLFEIFNSLPGSTREALEQRARMVSESGGKCTPATSLELAAPHGKRHPPRRSGGKLNNKSSSGSKKKKKATKGMRPRGTNLSPYAAFVKQQMPHLKHLPPSQRMKAIAENWKLHKAGNATSSEGNSVLLVAETSDALIK